MNILAWALKEINKISGLLPDSIDGLMKINILTRKFENKYFDSTSSASPLSESNHRPLTNKEVPVYN